MNTSVQTEQVPDALGALLEAKGQLKSTGVVKNPVGEMLESSVKEVPANSDEDPNKDDIEITEEETPAEEEENTSEESLEDEHPEDTLPPEPEPQDTRDYEKSYKELKQHYDKTVYELRTELNQVKDENSNLKQASITPPKTADELEAFREQYGEAFDIIRSVVIQEIQNGGVSQELNQKLTEVTQLEAEVRARESFKELLKEHPDASDIQKDPRFEKWFNEQPDSIKRILNSSDVKAISKQLTLYKMEVLGDTPKSKKQKKQKASVDASKGVSVKGTTEIAPSKKRWTGSEINEISKDYRKWSQQREEIELARRENRVDWEK